MPERSTTPKHQSPKRKVAIPRDEDKAARRVEHEAERWEDKRSTARRTTPAGKGRSQ